MTTMTLLSDSHGRTSVSAKRPENRTFGLMFAALFAAIAAVGWLLSGRILVWVLGTSGFLLLAALLTPGLLMPLNRLWALFGRRLGIVSNHLLLGIFFLLLITPMRGVLWILGRTSIVKRPHAAAQSYWTPVGRKATPETYVDMF